MSDPIRERAAETPDALGLIDAATGDSWTYAANDDAIQQRAAHLLDAGVEAGDRVAIISETHPAVAHLFFACWRIGAIAVPVNARLSQVELEEQLSIVDPVLVLAARPWCDIATAAAGDTQVRDIEDVETTERHSTPAQTGDSSSPNSIAEHSSAPTHDDVAMLFTSGTTGTPKAVRLTAENVAAAASAHRDRFGVEPDDRWLCPLSTYHMGGLAILLRSAHNGTTAVLQRTASGFDPAQTRRHLAEFDCTALSVVPVMLRRLLDDGPLPDSLRFVLSGGAPTPPALVERAVDASVPICPTYGMTETTAQVATATPAEAADHPESVGRPLAGVDVTVLDDTGDPVAPGAVGDIVVDGPTVTPGYVGGGGPFDDRGFHTGDLGRLDADGRLTVLDRREDRIVTGGENVHPAEVATVLASHPAVQDVAVLGLPDPEWGERVAALVVSHADATLDADELRAYARLSLAGYKVPTTVVLADHVPRTTSGTVDRHATRDAIRRRTGL